jgi:hypothetical protein
MKQKVFRLNRSMTHPSRSISYARDHCEVRAPNWTKAAATELDRPKRVWDSRTFLKTKFPPRELLVVILYVDGELPNPQIQQRMAPLHKPDARIRLITLDDHPASLPSRRRGVLTGNIGSLHFSRYSSNLNEL